MTYVVISPTTDLDPKASASTSSQNEGERKRRRKQVHSPKSIERFPQNLLPHMTVD